MSTTILKQLAKLAAILDSERAAQIQARRRLHNYRNLLLAVVAEVAPELNDTVCSPPTEARAELSPAELLTHIRQQLDWPTPVPAPAAAPSTADRVPPPPTPAATTPATDAPPPPERTEAYPPKPELPPARLCRAAGLRHTTYQRDLLLLYLLGKTGRARRPWLFTGLVNYLDTINSPTTGSLQRLLERLVADGLVAELALQETPAHLLRLSAQGQAGYRQLFAEPPVASVLTHWLEQPQPDLEHAGLTLCVAQALEKRGFQVVSAPPPVALASGESLQADLQFQRPTDEQPRYLLVVGDSASASRRRAQWRQQLAYQEAVYLAVPDKHSAPELRAAFIRWDVPGQLYITDVHYLNSPEAAAGTETVWRWRHPLKGT